MMNIDSKKISLIEKIIAVKNEGLVDAFLTAISINDEVENSTRKFSPSPQILNKMADLAEDDFEQKKYTTAAELLREIDNW